MVAISDAAYYVMFSNLLVKIDYEVA